MFKVTVSCGFFFFLMNQNSINWIRSRTFIIKSLQYVIFAQRLSVLSNCALLLRSVMKRSLLGHHADSVKLTQGTDFACKNLLKM